MRSAGRGLVVHAARILGVAVVVDCPSTILFREQLFDFPIPLFSPNAEFEVFPGDGVPILVHHHDSKQIAYRGEEEAVEVMLDAVADAVTEDVQDHLACNKDTHAKGDVSQWPSILEGVYDEDDLHDHVY